MEKFMNEPDQILNDKLKLLESWFSYRKGSIVAFSGGIDSTLVLFLARRFQGRQNVIGVISNSESLKNKDFKLAQTFCKEFDIPIRIIKTDELSDVRYSQNPVNRCFFCKDHLFQDLHKMLPDYPGHVILSGTNYDDLGDYRPGLDAAQKNGIESPLVDCKISKEEVRTIARHFNLPNWNKPASPCLSSRIPYNQVVTAEKLRQIEAAESILNGYGFEDVRVRHYTTYAKVEVLQADLEKLASQKGEIIREIMAIGFERVEIDPEGLVSGKMNRVLKPEESKK